MQMFRVFDSKENKYPLESFVMSPQGTLLIFDNNVSRFVKADIDRYLVECGVEIHCKKKIFEGDILEYSYGMTTFRGVIEFHDKVLEIGGECDHIRFLGFILHCGIEAKEEYYCPMPNEELAHIKIIGTVHGPLL